MPVAVAPPKNEPTITEAGLMLAGTVLAKAGHDRQGMPTLIAAIAQEGTYDFQRDVPQQKFHDPYIHAANYAAGVYMAGAGYSLTATLALAKLYALRNSKNYDAQDQLGWIQRGWKDATAGRWR